MARRSSRKRTRERQYESSRRTRRRSSRSSCCECCSNCRCTKRMWQAAGVFVTLLVEVAAIWVLVAIGFAYKYEQIESGGGSPPNTFSEIGSFEGTTTQYFPDPPADLAPNAIPRFDVWSSTYQDLSKPLPTNIWFTSAFLPQPPASSGDPPLLPVVSGIGTYCVPIVQFPWSIRFEVNTASEYDMMYLPQSTATVVGISADYSPNPKSKHIRVSDYYAVSPNAATQTTRGQITLRAQGALTTHTITYIDKLSVRAVWASAENAAATMTSTFVQGAPSLNVEYVDMYPLLASVWLPMWAVNGTSVFPNNHTFTQPSTTYTVFYGESATDKKGFTAVVVFSSPVTVTVVSTPLNVDNPDGGYRHPCFTTTEPFTGTVRLAILDENKLSSVTSMLANTKYPTGAKVGYSAGSRGKFGKLTFDFETKSMGSNGNGDVVHCGLPHQQKHLKSMPAAGVNWHSGVNGPMTCVCGDSWEFVYALPKVSFTSAGWADVPDKRKKAVCNTALDTEMKMMTSLSYPTDSYGFGKSIAKAAVLLMISQECDMANSSTVAAMTKVMKSEFDKWLTNSETDANIVFEPNFRGLMPSDALVFDSATKSFPNDFGAGVWNDFVIHSGYMIYAGAILSKYTDYTNCGSSECVNREEGLRHLARNLGNPLADDTLYTETRYKSVYVGHSWLSGFILYANGKNTESTSEIMNAYYGLKLLGSALGDSNMENMGGLLLATEVESVLTYYRSWSGSNVYEPFTKMGYAPGEYILTNKYSSMLSNENFFTCGKKSDDKICRNEMQLMPYTPATPLYLPLDFANEQFPSIASYLYSNTQAVTSKTAVRSDVLKAPLNAWVVRLIENEGAMDPEVAFKRALANLNPEKVNLDIGDSQTNALYWIATLQYTHKRTVTTVGAILLAVFGVELLTTIVVTYFCVRRCCNRRRENYTPLDEEQSSVNRGLYGKRRRRNKR